MKLSKFLIVKIIFIFISSQLIFNVSKAYSAEKIKIIYSIFSRTIEVNRTGKNIAILEEIQAFKLLKFDIRIHLNPKVKVSLSLDKNKALLILDGQGWDFGFQGNVKLLLEPSIFVEDNGKVKQTNQLILHGETLEERTEVLWGFTKN